MVVLPLLGLPAKAILIIISFQSTQLVIANQILKASSGCPLCCQLCNNDGLCQLIIDIIPTILDGNGAVSTLSGYHRDWLTGVAAQGEQEGIQLFVIGLNGPDNIFFAKLGSRQIHNNHPIQKLLAYANFRSKFSVSLR